MPFSGTATNMVYNSVEGGLMLAAASNIDDLATDNNWDGLGFIDYLGGTVSEGSYIFANTLDLAATYDLDLLSILKTRAFEPNNQWDDRTINLDSWTDIDGDDLGGVDTQLYARTTTDNPGSSPTWKDWQPFVNNTMRGRGFQFKSITTCSDSSQNTVIEQLGVTATLQRRTEAEAGITSGTSAKAVTFPSAFYATPSISITTQNMVSGDFAEVSSISRTGFTVTFKNSASTVSRVFDYQAVGHGRAIT